MSWLEQTRARFAGRAAGSRPDADVEFHGGEPRDGRAPGWLTGMSLDLKLGVRMLFRYPGLTLVAILALSVAIGGGAAYLEFVNDLYHAKLPFKDGDRIVGIYNLDVARGRAEPRALHDFAVWREELRVVDAVGAFRPLERNLITGDGRTEPVRGAEISASAFRMVQVPPLLGRPLVEEDERPGAPPVVVLGHGVWQGRFGGDSRVVGRTVRLGSTSATVVGVMPAGFAFPVNHGLWVPLRLSASDYPRGEGPSIQTFGRLAPGVDLDEAQSQLTALGLRAAADFPGTNQHLRPVVQPYVESLWLARQDGLLQMRIAYSLNLFFLGLLGVCAANVATLVFARTATREGEITVRTALGASRGRITAQLFAEALTLALVGAAIGLAAAAFGLRWARETMETVRGQPSPFWWSDTLMPSTLLYAGLLAVLAAVIVGVVPALKATGSRLQTRLKNAETGGSGMKFGGLWTGVIVTQVALTVIFLLVVVSVGWNVQAGRFGAVEVGFPTEEYLSVRLEMDGEAVPGESTAQEQAEFRARYQAAYRELERRMAAEPGVAGTTYASHLPGMDHPGMPVEVDGVPAPRDGAGAPYVQTASVDVGFFDTFNAPILSGRAFNAGDLEPGRGTVIVDQTFVSKVLGGRDPIGVRVRQAGVEGDEPSPWYEIVGVVRDLAVGKDKAAEDAVLYRAEAPGVAYPVHMAVHARGEPEPLVPRFRAAAGAVDPALRVYDLMPLDHIDRAGKLGLEFFVRVLALVGAVALILSTAGVYSLMSFTVTRRTREIGIRTAVGAGPRRILAAIFSSALAQVGLGVVVGSLLGSVVVAMGAPEVARGAGVAVGFAAFLAIAVFMLGVTLLACIIPARRALRIPPTEALRGGG